MCCFASAPERKKIYIDEKHVVNRRILWFPLLRCIKKTTSRFTWHFLRCISSFNVVRCIHPINVIDLINIQINTFTWWKWFHILSNRSTQCLDAKPALPKGKYQDSGPDAISLESSEWMCGKNALMRFDTTVVYNPFEVRSLFLQWSKHNPQLQTLEVMVFFTLFQWNFGMLFRMRCDKKKLTSKTQF